MDVVSIFATPAIRRQEDPHEFKVNFELSNEILS